MGCDARMVAGGQKCKYCGTRQVNEQIKKKDPNDWDELSEVVEKDLQ